MGLINKDSKMKYIIVGKTNISRVPASRVVVTFSSGCNFYGVGLDSLLTDYNEIYL
jgi:hypothetical protein